MPEYNGSADNECSEKGTGVTKVLHIRWTLKDEGKTESLPMRPDKEHPDIIMQCLLF